MIRVPLRTISPLLPALLLAGFLGLLGAVTTALPAAAAAGALVVSDPDSRQQSDDRPGTVNLVFEGKVDDDVAKVLVLDADGDNVTDGPLIVEGTNVTTYLLDDLPRGTYTVHYRVNGSGGQPRGGAFQFSYGQGSFVDPPDRSWSGSAQEPEILRGDDPNLPSASDPPPDVTPGVEVTSSDPTTGSTETSQPAQTDDPDDPDDPATDTTEAGQDPSKSVTATGVPVPDDGVGRAFLVGGVVLLAIVGGVGYGAYRRSRRAGTHD